MRYNGWLYTTTQLLMTKFGTKPYHPSLAQLMRLCAQNYALLSRLIVKNEKKGHSLVFNVATNLTLTLDIKEVTKYTTLVHLEQVGH